jgi:hypothetical protein
MSKGTEWHNLAVAAYIMSTFEPSEVRAPEGVKGEDHLRALLLADMNVNRQRIAEHTADLRYAVKTANIEGLRWSKPILRAWVVGTFFESVNYRAIYALIFDDIDE